MSNESIELFVTGRACIERDANLSEPERTQLLTLLEKGRVVPAAFLDRTTDQLIELLIRHTRAFEDKETPFKRRLTAFRDIKDEEIPRKRAKRETTLFRKNADSPAYVTTRIRSFRKGKYEDGLSVSDQAPADARPTFSSILALKEIIKRRVRNDDEREITLLEKTTP